MHTQPPSPSIPEPDSPSPSSPQIPPTPPSPPASPQLPPIPPPSPFLPNTLFPFSPISALHPLLFSPPPRYTPSHLFSPNNPLPPPFLLGERNLGSHGQAKEDLGWRGRGRGGGICVQRLISSERQIVVGGLKENPGKVGLTLPDEDYGSSAPYRHLVKMFSVFFPRF